MGFDGLLRDETPLSRIKPSSMHSEAMRSAFSVAFLKEPQSAGMSFHFLAKRPVAYASAKGRQT